MYSHKITGTMEVGPPNESYVTISTQQNIIQTDFEVTFKF